MLYLPIEVCHGNRNNTLGISLSGLRRCEGLCNVRLAARLRSGRSLHITSSAFTSHTKSRRNQSVRGGLEGEREKEGKSEEEFGEHAVE